MEEDKTRDLVIAVTVNKKEKEYLREKANEARVTLAGYCRLVLFGKMTNESEKV